MRYAIDQIRHALDNQLVIRDYPQWDQQIIQSAVLLPLVADSCELSLVYTRRADDLDRHAGQVSFPGGVRERGDKNPVETAVRETFEEIGINPEKIEIIATMKPYNSSTGFCVYPVIGYLMGTMDLIANREVEKSFCVPLSWLSQAESSYQADYRSSDQTIHKVWFFKEYAGEIIWGLTAQITIDFLRIIKKER